MESRIVRTLYTADHFSCDHTRVQGGCRASEGASEGCTFRFRRAPRLSSTPARQATRGEPRGWRQRANACAAAARRVCELPGPRGRGACLEDVEADIAVLVDVWMEARREEGHLGRLIGVARRELERELEGQPLIHLTQRGAGASVRATVGRPSGEEPQVVHPSFCWHSVRRLAAGSKAARVRGDVGAGRQQLSGEWARAAYRPRAARDCPCPLEDVVPVRECREACLR